MLEAEFSAKTPLWLHVFCFMFCTLPHLPVEHLFRVAPLGLLFWGSTLFWREKDGERRMLPFVSSVVESSLAFELSSS